MIWPTDLAFLYPYRLWQLWQVLGAVLIFVAVSLMVIMAAKRFRYLIVGWLWYVVTLVPVIGLVQVGGQAIADRYAYVPLIGLFIMAAWGIPELLEKWRYRQKVLFASSILMLSCCIIVTWTQVGYWQNDIMLFDHTLKVTDNNDVAYYNRGDAYHSLGNYKQAIADYDRAIEINPKSTEAYYNRGNVYYSLGNYKQAIADYDRAIEINPGYTEAYINRGKANANLGYYKQAIVDFDRVIEVNPKPVLAYLNRGNAYAALGNQKQSIADYDRAIEINPKYAEAYNNRAASYERVGNKGQVLENLKAAAALGYEPAQNYLRSRGINW